MKLREIMTTEVEIIAPTDSVMDASKKMRDLDFGSLPVCYG
jgi:CBS domain-containing protein